MSVCEMIWLGVIAWPLKCH